MKCVFCNNQTIEQENNVCGNCSTAKTEYFDFELDRNINVVLFGDDREKITSTNRY